MLVNLPRGQLSVWKLRLSEKNTQSLRKYFSLICIPIDLELFNNHASGKERVGGLGSECCFPNVSFF